MIDAKSSVVMMGKPFFRSRGRILGLFGLGRIGRAVVRKAKAAQAVLDVLKGGLPKAIVNPQVVKEKIGFGNGWYPSADKVW